MDTTTSVDKPGGHTVGHHRDWPQTAPLKQIIEQIKEAIWRRRPILGDIMKGHGNDALCDYAQDFLDVNKAPVLDARKHELIDTAEELIGKRLGAHVGKAVARQLRKMPMVSTADHHGPIDHPFWVNANIITALPYADQTDPDVQFLVVFSFASVSINNASAYPRGILFHGGENGSGPLVRLPIMPDREKMGVVYGMRSFKLEDLDRAKADLVKRERAGEITDGRAAKITEILNDYFASADVLNAPDLASQITKINYRLWPKLFHQAHHKLEATKIPDLIYLEIETLVTELLLRYHLDNSASLINKFLFDPKYQEQVQVLFNNIPGAFSHEKDWGTHLFWAVDEKLHRVRLFLRNGFLESNEDNIRIAFTPEGIREALQNKKIFPSMVTCYLLVSLYYGMKCLGGFCQVNDLTMTKEAWQELLKRMGEMVESDAVAPVQTKELGGDGMVLSYLKTPTGDLVAATGIDMMLEEPETTFTGYRELAKRVTLSEIMNPMLPEMYTVLYSIQDRDPALTAVSPEAIMKAVDLHHKICQKLTLAEQVAEAPAM